MIGPLSAQLKRLSLVAVCAAGIGGLPASASAQAAQAQPVPTDTRRLTDDERQAILAGNTVESVAAARGELPGSNVVDHRVHGEVGIMAGTGGARAIYGTADIPLGDRAGATVSFESSRFGYRR